MKNEKTMNLCIYPREARVIRQTPATQIFCCGTASISRVGSAEIHLKSTDASDLQEAFAWVRDRLQLQHFSDLVCYAFADQTAKAVVIEYIQAMQELGFQVNSSSIDEDTKMIVAGRGVDHAS